MTRAVLSIGSNLGDRLANLQVAVSSFAPWLRAVSPVFRTPPWGPVPQGHFLNAVLIADDPAAAPADWLARAHRAEDAAGRTREVRWGPRTLDVDIVAVDDADGGCLRENQELTLPHPRAHERAFVLVPWLAVDPAATLTGKKLQSWVDALAPADVAAVRPVPDAVLTPGPRR